MQLMQTVIILLTIQFKKDYGRKERRKVDDARRHQGD